MQLTPYNQDIINRAISHSIVDPIVFCGMFNDGHDFLYANLVKQIATIKSDFVPVLDLSACSTETNARCVTDCNNRFISNKNSDSAGYDDLKFSIETSALIKQLFWFFILDRQQLLIKIYCSYHAYEISNIFV